MKRSFEHNNIIITKQWSTARVAEINNNNMCQACPAEIPQEISGSGGCIQIFKRGVKFKSNCLRSEDRDGVQTLQTHLSPKLSVIHYNIKQSLLENQQVLVRFRTKIDFKIIFLLSFFMMILMILSCIAKISKKLDRNFL